MSVKDERDLDTEEEVFLLGDEEDSLSDERPQGFQKYVLLVSVVIVVPMLVLVVVTTFLTFKNQVAWVSSERDERLLPLKGENFTISHVKTKWEYKEKGGQEAGGGLSELEYFPSVMIHVKNVKQSAQLRCFFVNEEGRYVGNPITKEVSGNVNIYFQSTQGFQSESAYHSYFSGFGASWYLELLEGAPKSSALSEFNKLARIKLPYITPQEHQKALSQF